MPRSLEPHGGCKVSISQKTPMQTLCYYFGTVSFYVALPVLELTMYTRLTLNPEIHLQLTLEVWDKRLHCQALPKQDSWY